jgi:predicted dehydrogenase
MGHAPALQALGDDYEVVALADADPETLDETGVLLGLPPGHRFADYRELLLRVSPDVAVISVPHARHHEVATAALRAGAHLVTERPLALSLRDAEELLRFAEARGRLVTVAHYYLHYPPVAEAVRLVRAGAVGTPFFARIEGVTGGYGAGTESYHPAWHADIEQAGGGVWLDSGYHAAYLAVALLGSPVISLAARTATLATDLPVDDTAAALCLHDNGGISSLQAAWSVPAGGTRVLEVHGTAGSLQLDHEGHPLGVFDNAARTWRHPEIAFHHAGSFLGLYAALAACLRFGAPPPVTHREALHALDVIISGYRASENESVEGVAE